MANPNIKTGKEIFDEMKPKHDNGNGMKKKINWRLFFVIAGFYLFIMILFVIGLIVGGYFK